ncbi:dienelactone hydrolase family protein [Deinococcus oregonensis]|uniref:Dienelactone hydrolase family protein n=1 Tax=Deinococcus oregonensis TaxID=1805970 RepID=A0ABV6ATP5_9DEIO
MDRFSLLLWVRESFVQGQTEVKGSLSAVVPVQAKYDMSCRQWSLSFRRMSEILLFHHAQGLTPGILAFAKDLRKAGHLVHTPDLYHGRTFDTLDDGLAYARQLGFSDLEERGVRAADALSNELVYAGFSLGVGPAQKLVQSRSGAKGALFFHACLPVTEFELPWPQGVSVQVHAMEGDPFFEEDAAAAQALMDTVQKGELFWYPGNEHLFSDSSLPSYDGAATSLLKQRVLDFLRES